MRKKHGRFYCIECLRKWGRKNVAKDRICPFCNVPLRKNTARIVAQVVTRLLRHRGLKAKTKKSDYEEYLASDKWKTIRGRVLARDGYLCRACHKPAEVVHHKSYDRDVMDGLNDDQLISLCHPCHSHIEFTVVGGKQVKNGLRTANRKLSKMVTSANPEGGDTGTDAKE